MATPSEEKVSVRSFRRAFEQESDLEVLKRKVSEKYDR